MQGWRRSRWRAPHPRPREMGVGEGKLPALVPILRLGMPDQSDPLSDDV